ncbi:MAG: amino acid permease [Candidatus Bathyarchaeota archaeon]|nr:amino acid permease [Candidatus Bathyarchaeota archaeon]
MNRENVEESRLKPTLGLFDATAINVGAIIGAGIFVVTGIAAGLAGPALLISMLIAAIISLFTALSFTELTAWLPREGSVYEFAYQLVSPFAGFLAGWMWMLSNTFGGAAVSLAFAYYLTSLFPNLYANWVAAILCIAFTTLNFFGIRQSALLNNLLVVVKLLILAFFFVFGLGHINQANFSPFAPSEIGVLYGACYIFFAYGGFARAAVVAEEVKNAKRVIPRAILFSLVISTVFYILVGVVAVGLVGASKLSISNSPLTEAISATGSPVAAYIVSSGGLIATASVLLTSILGVSRVAYAMARRKDLPQAFRKLHPKYNTPYYSVWIVGILMTLLVLFMDLTKVVAISTFAMLFYYSIANVSALRLKAKKKMYSSVVPALGTATCLALLVFILFTSPQAWIMGVAGLVAGTVCSLLNKRQTIREWAAHQLT